MSIRGRLRILILVTLLPVTAVGAATAYVLLEKQRETVQRGARDQVRAIMTAIDTQLRSAVTALELLARAPSLDRDDLVAFRVDAERALAVRHGEWANIIVSDPDSAHMLFNLQGPPIASKDPQTVLDAARTMRPVVSRVAVGRLQRPLFAVRVPVIRDGRARYVISALVETATVAQVIDQQELPKSWAVGVLDRDLQFVVRWPPLMQRTGTPHESLVQALGGSPDGWQRGRLRDGSEVYRAFRRSAFSGWVLSIAIPRDEVEAGLRVTWLLIAGVTAAAVLGLWIAWVFASRITRPIAALARAAPALGRGDVSALPPAGSIEEVRDLAQALGEAAAAIRDREARQLAAEQALRAADRAKAEFLAMLGHELRNPLASVSNVAHLLKVARDQPALLAKVSEVLDRQVQHMTHLVNDLLEMGRITSGKVHLDRQPLDLAATAGHVLAALISGGRFARHDLVRELEPAWVMADAVRMEQVLSNLIDNALKFTPPGGTIRVRVRREGWHALVEVSDTGAGMSQELIARMFELFAQGERTLAREPGGLGIGLTMAKRLVELHEGTIRGASEGPGKGSTFTVSLPAIEAPAPKITTAPSAERGRGKRRLLRIEDNEDARESMAVLLRSAGHEVHTAADGRTGVELAATLVPDFALVDIGLPDIDGYEVARQLRTNPGTKGLRLVAISGYGTAQDQQRSVTNGFEQHLTKPVAFEAIEALLSAE